jgi:threonine dehydratase
MSPLSQHQSRLLPLTRASVQHAHEVIKPYVYRTPVLTNTTLSNLASTPQSADALKGTPWEGMEPAKPKVKLFFKCENFQRIGAFKVRGAFYAVSRLSDAQRETGVVTHSSGRWCGFSLVLAMDYGGLMEKFPKTPGSGPAIFFIDTNK